MGVKLIRSKLIGLTLLSLLLVACSNGEEASNDSDTNDYPTDTITWVVPYSEGGGFDTDTRRIASYLEEELSDDASIVVENITGGEGNIGISEVERADPDGHTLGVVNFPGQLANQITGDAEYDLFDMEYIGDITGTNYMMALSAQSEYDSLEDLQEADVVRAAITSVSATDGLGLTAAAEALDINLETINRDGASDTMLAAARGDVDIVQPVYTSLEGYIEEGDLEPLVLMAEERLDEYDDVPTIAELGHEDVLDVASGNRIVVAPPHTPEEILNILRESFNEVVDNPEYIEDAEEVGVMLSPGDYQDAEEIAEDSYDAMMEYQDLLEEEG